MFTARTLKDMRSTLRLFACALLCSLLAFSCSYTDIGSQTDWAVYETKFPRGATADTRVVVADIDDASLSQLGGWPLDRSLYVKAAEQAFRSGAAVVALDLIFESEQSAKGDEALVELAKNKRVVFAYQSMPETPRARLFRDLALAGPVIGYVDAGWGPNRDVITMIPDISGEKSLVSVVADLYCEQAKPACKPSIKSSATDMVYGTRATRLWGINFAAPTATFARVPFHKLLSTEVGALRGKIVIFSPSAPSLNDRYWIPDGEKRSWQPGSVALAFAVETAIAGTSLFVLPAWVLVLSVAICNGLVLSIYQRLRRLRNPLMGTYLALQLGTHWVLFKWVHLHLPVSILVVNAVCVWIAAKLMWPRVQEPDSQAKPFSLDSDFLSARNQTGR